MSFFSRFNPVPSFPSYKGPYRVGTKDFEIPVSDLSPANTPSSCLPISTISFRLFYPCDLNESKSKSVYWLPSPQGEWFKAYTKFMSAGPLLSTFLSYVPFLRLIFHTTIPALDNAPLLNPSKSSPKVSSWPVLVFSHGLGGSKNAYSHVCGSLASYGMVVAAIEHRDGSCPISYICKTPTSDAGTIDYERITGYSTETMGARRNQLSIRSWELALLHAAILQIQEGRLSTNLASPDLATQDFSFLDVYGPGKIALAGHSFGAASIAKFLKLAHFGKAINSYSVISQRLTQSLGPQTPAFYLDLWAEPLFFEKEDTSHMPLPSQSDGSDPKTAVPPIAVLSESFFKWKSNRDQVIRLLTSQPSSPTNQALSRSTAAQPPYIFYPAHSAHLSQSDFGILFPLLTKKVLKAEEPERTLTLNVRAVLEGLRRAGWKVADSAIETDENDGKVEGKGQDWRILDREGGKIKGWMPVNTDINGTQ